MKSLLSNEVPSSALHRQSIPRELIFNYIQLCDTHPSADEIFQALKPKYPSLSLATIYNTLQFLVSEGKISVLGDLGDRRIHFDKSVDPHLNMVCERCKKVIDIPSKVIDRSLAQVEAESGFKIHGSRFIFFGLCPDCQQKPKN